MNFVVNYYQGSFKLLLIQSNSDEQEFLESHIGEIVELSQPASYNEALEWAANWITGAQSLGRGAEVEKFAHDMAMSIRAAKRPTSRALDVAEVCDCGEPFPESGYCKFCGARQRQRQ